MLKNLYKRFLEWALAPVVGDIAERQSVAEANIASLQAQCACTAQAIYAAQEKLDNIDAGTR